ncbi:MAG: hypothetical protein R3C49_17810 [Planctomycetaceae bacterium]
MISRICEHGRFELFASGCRVFSASAWSGGPSDLLVVSARSTDIEELTGREGLLPGRLAQILADRSPLPPVEVVTGCGTDEGRALLRQYTELGGNHHTRTVIMSIPDEGLRCPRRCCRFLTVIISLLLVGCSEGGSLPATDTAAEAQNHRLLVFVASATVCCRSTDSSE